MAQKVITELVDDLDGTVLADGEGETVEFALDGTAYTLDLTQAHAAEFRGVLADYVAAATRVTTKRRTIGNFKKATAPGPAEVRAWANDNGHDLPERGRIPTHVREAYDRAH